MNKSGVLAICRLIELLKCIQYTFHRRALIVAEYLVMIINHYEHGLLNQLDYSWVCVCGREMADSISMGIHLRGMSRIL